ncbi:DUF3159 domain-containing protein [Gordonia sp. JH63]|uniref:DUF3159 domain-containing protein n=1 Tax=Gordonia sp. JH63 TaxID=2698900 RepID=UPI00131FCB70|nr:DUF3159 domain-containing protein [Gordonia sp. JH63]QHD85345.1 DUF3159 domain-containing protein [Gordonia sp. JH63]
MTTHRTDVDERRPKTPDAQQVLMDQLGGMSGMIYSAIPVVVFVIANATTNLPIAIGAAIAVAVLTAGLRLARDEPVVQASGGIIGVAAAGAVAAATGSADGYFLLGIWSNGIEALIVLVTVLVRRPLTGLLWNLLHGNKYSWRHDRSVMRAHDIATLTLTAVLASRFGVQLWFYETHATGMLATAKIAMGFPLFAAFIGVAVWAFRRSTRQLVE